MPILRRRWDWIPLCLILTLTGMADGQEVRFSRRATKIHDVAHQKIRCDMSGERTIRQHNQVVDASKQQLDRVQERTLTILAVEAGRPIRAKIDYHQSATKLVQENGQTVEAVQPVSGHAYFAQLRGDDLIITDSQGSPPTPEEEQIVRANLQAFGKPNPLSQFLDGKRLQVGQSIQLPEEVARELMGLTGTAGAADTLTLKLVNVKEIDHQPCAVFETSLRANNQQAAAISLLMKGQLIVEIGTCRTRQILLTGPVAISEEMGPAQGKFIVSTNGNLRVAVEASFQNVRR